MNVHTVPPAPAGAQIPHEPAALIAHILTNFHEVHRRELPELVRLARKVEARHADHPLAPGRLVPILESLQAELLDHMRKEEDVLFPMMRMGGHPMIVHPIARMRLEHDDHGTRLEQLRLITHGYRLPEDACPTWRALYAGLNKFTADLMNHVHLENNLLFPQFARPEAG